MLFVLFALSLLATFRGWFPWALIVFGAMYAFLLVDSGALSYSTTLSNLAIGASDDSVVLYGVGAILGGMVVFERH